MLKRKRISSIFLALVMLFSVIVALPKQVSAATDFDDVEAGDTFADHIAYVSDKGAFQGLPIQKKIIMRSRIIFTPLGRKGISS